NIVQTGDNVAINQATLKINQANKSAGELIAKGTVDLKNMGGDLTLTVNDLNQEILKPLAGQYLAGRDLKTISIDVALSASKSKDAKLSGTAKIKNLLVDDPQGIIPSKPIDVLSDINISLSEKGIADIKRLNVSFNQGGKFVGALDCAGTYNLSNNACRIKLNVKDVNEEGLAPFLPPIADIGTIKTISINGGVDANVDLKTDSTITGDLNINNLLIVGTNKVPVSQPLAISANLSTKINSKGLITVDRIAGNIKEGNNPAGSFTITASYNTNNGTATGSLKVNDLNQNLLKIYPILAGKTLKQVSINVDIAGNYNPKADSALTGNVKIGGVVIEDLKTKAQTPPLDLGFAVDGKMQKQVIDLNKFQIVLPTTKLAENKINIAGKINLEKTSAIAGNVNLTSDSIDLTPIFEILSATTASTNTSVNPTPQPTTSAEAEMPPVTLPLSNFVFQASIKKLYLNSLEVVNILAATKINGGQVELNPFQLALNNTPVNFNAKLNLGVPGYQYDIAAKVPGLNLSPIISSLKPDLATTVNGVLYSDIVVKGAGTTGKSLKENLNGKVLFNLTNANIQVVSSKTIKTILTPIVLILG
ncbi:MAG TPA: AsmA family protein, partial [Verrucomicrobiota bacterium]|nr:AsmA family protein [Verrucomicrobiota bacterium]